MEAFFAVMDLSGNFVRYNYEDAAKRAARAAAKARPGEPAFLLRAVQAFTYRDPVEVEMLTEPDDDVPF